MEIRVLIVDDEPLLGAPLKRSLEGAGYQVTIARNGAEALRTISGSSFDLLLQDLGLPDADGLEIMAEILGRIPCCRALVMTGHGTIEKAVAAMKIGACDFLTKPFAMESLFQKLQRITDLRQIEHQVDLMDLEQTFHKSCVTRSPIMKEILHTAAVVATTDATVLLLGESGTGKDLLADIIHQTSRRSSKTFIKVNCAAIPESLFESELFGVDRGAFTGAERSRSGRIEEADQGTLFLDEIGELPLFLQGKFLRVLGEKRIYRIGGSREYSVDFRLIAATNKNLLQLIASHAFREDLYFRINVVPITVPPLRNRIEDIPLLIAYFEKTFSNQDPTRKKPIFSPEALEMLCKYHFPGNVRELRNMIEQLFILYPGSNIKPHHLSLSMQNPVMADRLGEGISIGKPLRDAVADFENRYIEKVMESVGGHKSKSASILGLSRKVLWERLKKTRS
ncbi:sigma-54 dependent transcriptional regulator [Geotalea sp. SG265]|uniref:sigma-54-dependent transcriptional regulator n=1 Tax=Geotalea sp. SG265 TaxID=2922867 RepID=UPI001FAF02DE|nr:sigma-54 dependent transcriptional regulator [Geotalea sp. SG265]